MNGFELLKKFVMVSRVNGLFGFAKKCVPKMRNMFTLELSS